MKKVLILGSRGMLGQELVRVYRGDETCETVGWDYEDIDLTDFAVAEGKIKNLAPMLVVNAAAYNAVDQCEESAVEFEKAMLLNATVPEFLARLARDMGATFIHYSTDYVFDGENKAGYAEDALPQPLSKYGLSKYEGEKRVLALGGHAYLIRLSKLFGRPATSATGKKSFFEKMLAVAREKTEVTGVDDERSCFTYAPDLALATKILEQEKKPYGVYHLANAGPATWYEAAVKLFQLAGKTVKVTPVPGSAFPRPARRPRYSELLNTKFIPLRPYEEALAEYLRSEVQ